MFFKSKFFYVCPRRRLLSFVLTQIDIADGMSLETHDLLNTRVKGRV